MQLEGSLEGLANCIHLRGSEVQARRMDTLAGFSNLVFV